MPPMSVESPSLEESVPQVSATTESDIVTESSSISSVLDVAVACWHQHMQPAALVRWRDGMQRFVSVASGDISYGTGCSGSEIIGHTLRALATHWRDIFDIQVSFAPKFACEKEDSKQA